MMRKYKTMKHAIAWMLAMTLVLGAALSGCGSQPEEAPVQTTAPETPETQATAVTEPQVPGVLVETAFFSAELPATCEGKIRHMEVSADNITMEVFYMLMGDQDRELFRVGFGSAAVGDAIGTLKAGDEELLVTLSVPVYEQGDFADEQSLNTYYSLMDQLDTILTAIRSIDGFSSGSTAAAPAPLTKKAVLAYWEVELPESMFWEERKNGGIYRADFYGMIEEERIALYSITIGDQEVTSVLGNFRADGWARPLGVEVFELSTQLPWTDEDQVQAHAIMMDTINDVLAVIMASPDFIPLEG